MITRKMKVDGDDKEDEGGRDDEEDEGGRDDKEDEGGQW